MIKFEYKPNVINTPFGALDDPPPVESVTMTLGGDVSWEEAVCEFHNFLRAAGYVIPYDFEEEKLEEREWVGLTEQEFQDATEDLYTEEDFWEAIESKLKEKNT